MRAGALVVDGQVQGGLVRVVCGVDFGASVQQSFRQLGGVLDGGVMQRGLSGGVARVDAYDQQRLGRGQVAAFRHNPGGGCDRLPRHGQRSPVRMMRDAEGVCEFHKQGDGIQLASDAGKNRQDGGVCGLGSLRILRVVVRMIFNRRKRRGAGEMRGGRQSAGRRTCGVCVVCAAGCVVRKEDGLGAGASGFDGEVQRGLSVVVGCVDFRAVFQQFLRQQGGVLGGGVMQGGLSVVVAGVDALQQQGFHGVRRVDFRRDPLGDRDGGSYGGGGEGGGAQRGGGGVVIFGEHRQGFGVALVAGEFDGDGGDDVGLGGELACLLFVGHAGGLGGLSGVLQVFGQGEGVVFIVAGEDDSLVGFEGHGGGRGGGLRFDEVCGNISPAFAAEGFLRGGGVFIAFFGAEEGVQGGAVVGGVAFDDMLEESAAGEGVGGADEAEGSDFVHADADAAVGDGGDLSAEVFAEFAGVEAGVFGVVFGGGGFTGSADEVQRHLRAAFGNDGGHRRGAKSGDAQHSPKGRPSNGAAAEGEAGA